MKIVVIGSKGQLALQFLELKTQNHNWNFLSKNSLDVTKKENVIGYFTSNSYDIIINCSGFTDVEKAEQNHKAAYELNEIAVQNLIIACETSNSKLIHFSTDYVFDGASKIPYKETDLTLPLNVYGKSKKAGESLILKSNINYLIIRSSWIYSSFGDNFVKKLLNLSKEKHKIEVVDDQIGNPTFAYDLVKVCISIINNKNYKWGNPGQILHYSNEGECSWYEFAAEIFRLKGINIQLKRRNSNQINLLAKRPKYSGLDKTKIKSILNLQIPRWEKSLSKMINKL